MITIALIMVAAATSWSNGQENGVELTPPRSRLTLAGHTDQVTHACFSGDRKQLATCSHDGTAVVWDVASGAELSTFVKGTHLICLSFNRKGDRIIVGGYARQGERMQANGLAIIPYAMGGSISFWDWKTSRLKDNFEDLPEPPRGLISLDNDNAIAIIDRDYNMFILDRKTNSLTYKNDTLHAQGDTGRAPTSKAVFGADGKRAVAWRVQTARHANGNPVYVAALACWDNEKANSRVLLSYPKHRFATAGLTFDGTKIMMFTLENKLLYYNFEGELLKQVDDVQTNFVPDGKIEHFGFNDNGQLLVMIDDTGVIEIKDSVTLTTVWQGKIDNYQKNRVRAVAFSASSDQLLILRGGFDYKPYYVIIDGEKRVAPESLTLETYNVRDRK